MNQTTESYPLLREAYAIIDGVPDRVINLARFSNTEEIHECGTIACAAGLLCMHPKFQALGLSLGESGGMYFPAYQGRVEDGLSRYTRAGAMGWDGALSRIFGISEHDAFLLFAPRYNNSRYSPPAGVHMTDKQVWQYRVREFLRIKDAEPSAGQ